MTDIDNLNIGAYLVDKQKYEVREAPMLVIKNPDDVLIRIDYVGICGADQDMFLTGRFGIFDVDFPKIIGHEAAGTVVAIGPAVKNIKVGDKVALEPGVPCGKCEQCITGHYNLCAEVVFKGAPPVTGCNQRFVVHPAAWCFPLPGDMTTRLGSLMEPLAVGMHAANQGGVRLGDTVVINGAGTIGLCALAACRAKGATSLIVIDKSPVRLMKAEAIGAATINLNESDPIKKVAEITKGRGADVVIEASGNAIGFLNTAYYVRTGGCICCVGLGPKPIIEVDYQTLIYKEVTIKTVNRYCHDFPLCISALEADLLNTEGIITHEFPLEKIQEAYEFAINNKDIAIKTIISF